MYEICNVVCGYKLQSEMRYLIDEITGDYEGLGFDQEYSGNNEFPVYCGVIIFDFNASDVLSAEDLITKLIPTQEQLIQASEKMAKNKLLFNQFCDDPENQISTKEKEEMCKLIPEKPGVFLMWSTS